MEKFVVVGLGNPGDLYKKTRHNAGYMTVEYMAERAGVKFANSKFDGLVAEYRENELDIFLLKPTTFMNLSGVAVRKLLAFYKIPIDRMVVISDDFAIPFETLRIRASGSDGGHKGLRSIASELGTNQFARLKIGVGPLPQLMDAADFVLGAFSKEQLGVLQQSIVPKAAEAIGSILNVGIAKSMTEYNRKSQD